MKFLKHLFAFLFIASFAFSSNAQKGLDSNPTVNTVPAARPAIEMSFEQELTDLGKVKRGDKKEFDFSFINKGSETLEIEIVSGCECSILDWTIRPIAPGEQGTINVIFDSTEKEESETVDIDITLKNLNPETGYQYFKIVNFKFELI